MASNVSEETFQCSTCDQFLDLASKTLPCLHSLCRSCVESHIEGATIDSGKCPQYHEPVVTPEKLRLSPYLVKSLSRHQLESSEWMCDGCFKEGVESAGQIWCHDCQKRLCNNCDRGHKKSQPMHKWEDLHGLARGEAIRVITTDECLLHRKSKDAFCERSNVCLCDACYRDHVTASPQCPPRPLSVREEASKGKQRGPTLEQEHEIRVANPRTRRSIEQLSTDCDIKCSKFWQDFDAFMEDTRYKLGKLCDEMREARSDQERKWRLSIKERDDLVKRMMMMICFHNLCRLLRDDSNDEDVVCGLLLMRAELSLRRRQSFAPVEKGHLLVTFISRMVSRLPRVTEKRNDQFDGGDNRAFAAGKRKPSARIEPADFIDCRQRKRQSCLRW